MNEHRIQPVILCGGSGTRLWPLSRAGFPKQFLVLSGTTSLFQQAVERVNQLGAVDITVGNTLVVTNEEHRFLALEQLREIEGVNATLLLESVGRNTAVGYQGRIDFDTSKPDGAPRKWMDSSRLNALGWQAKVDLQHGLSVAYQDFVSKL